MKCVYFLVSALAAAQPDSQTAVDQGGDPVASGPPTLTCFSLSDGGGWSTNGSIGIAAQLPAGRAANSAFTLDMGPVPCMFTGGGEPPAPGSGLVIWMSFKAPTIVPGVGSVEDEDIVAYDFDSDTWSLVFDGSDVGLARVTIDGMARDANGDILLSFADTASVSRNIVDDSDIVRFTPTSLGNYTAGTFTVLFDGSDVGLSDDSEDVDAIDVAGDGRLVLSTLGAFNANGVAGSGEDLIAFSPVSLGWGTSGSLAMYFDGSDVGLATADENVDAVAHDAAAVVLSTDGPFLVVGATGDRGDVLEFSPTSLGATTSGGYSLLLDLSTLGITSAADIGSLEIVH